MFSVGKRRGKFLELFLNILAVKCFENALLTLLDIWRNGGDLLFMERCPLKHR